MFSARRASIDGAPVGGQAVEPQPGEQEVPRGIGVVGDRRRLDGRVTGEALQVARGERATALEELAEATDLAMTRGPRPRP